MKKHYKFDLQNNKYYVRYYKRRCLMTIETPRLIFREWSIKDADFVIDGLNDLNVAKYLTVPFPYTNQDAIDFIEKHTKNDDKNFYFAVERKEDLQIIGGSNIFINEQGEFRGGLWLHRDFQGQGYGTEIWTARAKFAFDILGAEKLINGFYDFNERSKKMQLKMGYEIIGEKTNYCPALKSSTKEIVTRLTKTNFEKYYNSIDFSFSVKE